MLQRICVLALAMFACAAPATAQITATAPRPFAQWFSELFPEFTSSSSLGYGVPDLNAVFIDLDLDGDLDVVMPIVINVRTTLGPATPVRFLENTGAGDLIESHAKFLEGPVPSLKFYRNSCVADFNRDGRLDVFFESTGYEGANGDFTQWTGERNMLLLSQPGGKLKDVSATHLPQHLAFSHLGACGSDLSGDGVADYYQNIIGYGPQATRLRSNLQFNDGLGKFTAVADTGVPGMPAQRVAGSNTYIDPVNINCITNIYAIIDVKSAPWAPAHLWFGEAQNTCLAGKPPYVNVLMKNDGTGHFTMSTTDTPPNPHPRAATGDPVWAANDINSVDIDDDGDDDIVAVFNPSGASESAFQIIKQDAPGHFIDVSAPAFLDSPPSLVGSGLAKMFIADVNGDGAPDLYTQRYGATTQQADYVRRLWLNDGYGRFDLQEGLNPNTALSVVGLADLDGDGWAEILSSGFGAGPHPGPNLTTLSLRGPSPASIVGAVAPLTRSVQTGQTATAFATIVNASDKPLKGCRIQPPRTRASTFSYQATNPATNAPVGAPNTEIDVAANGVQSFVFAVSVNDAINGEDLKLELDCRNTKDAASIDGLSLFRLSASAQPTPDIVPIAVTPSGDGVMRLAGGAGFFAAAAVNIGAAGDITVKPVSTTSIPAALSICESGPTGACLAPPAAQVTASFASNQTRTFSIFGAASGAISPDFAAKRVLLDFNRVGGGLVGRASVAVTTSP